MWCSPSFPEISQRITNPGSEALLPCSSEKAQKTACKDRSCQSRQTIFSISWGFYGAFARGTHGRIAMIRRLDATRTARGWMYISVNTKFLRSWGNIGELLTLKIRRNSVPWFAGCKTLQLWQSRCYLIQLTVPTLEINITIHPPAATDITIPSLTASKLQSLHRARTEGVELPWPIARTGSAVGGIGAALAEGVAAFAALEGVQPLQGGPRRRARAVHLGPRKAGKPRDDWRFRGGLVNIRFFKNGLKKKKLICWWAIPTSRSPMFSQFSLQTSVKIRQRSIWNLQDSALDVRDLPQSLLAQSWRVTFSLVSSMDGFKRDNLQESHG